MRFFSLIVLFCVLFLACQEEKKESAINYAGFITGWTEAVKDKKYDKLNKYEYASKTPEEYADLYDEYYFRNIVVFDKSEINAKVMKVKISGETVDRKSGIASPFFGEVEFLQVNEGYGFKIFNKIIYRSK